MIIKQEVSYITLFDSGAVSRLDQIIAKNLFKKGNIFAVAPMTINELANNTLGNKTINKYDFKLFLDWEEIIRHEFYKLNKQEIPLELSNFPLKNGKHQRIPPPNVNEIQKY